MSEEDGDGDRLAGLPPAEAAEAVAETNEDVDAEAARVTLERVAEDGVVSREGADEALAELSKLVATAETRTELAGIALSDARETAEPVADLDAVRSRLDEFESRLEAVESRAADLGSALEAIVRPDDRGLYAVARDAGRVDAAARSVQQAADELQVDVESFERWVQDEERRVEELEDDVDAVADPVEELTATCEELADVIDGDDAHGPESVVALSWADATLRHRVLALFLEDVRAELADLRAWGDRTGGESAGDVDDVAARIDRLDARLDATGARLDDLARPAWVEHYREDLAGFEAALAEFAPPVDWEEVHAELEAHRDAIDVG
jgi:DNA repair exonuclease SbcCD ATPase subunit